MKTISSIVFLSLCLTMVQPAYSQCGGEKRWEVKVLTDERANQINLTPINATVRKLRAWRDGSTKDGTKRLVNEKKTVKVRALLCEYIHQADSDYHLILIDSRYPEDSIIAEIPDPTCEEAKNSGHAEEYQEALDSLKAISGGRLNKTKKTFNPPACVWVQGVAFYDPPHSGRKPKGNAPNNLEIHPVMKMGRRR